MYDVHIILGLFNPFPLYIRTISVHCPQIRGFFGPPFCADVLYGSLLVVPDCFPSNQRLAICLIVMFHDVCTAQHCRNIPASRAAAHCIFCKFERSLLRSQLPSRSLTESHALRLMSAPDIHFQYVFPLSLYLLAVEAIGVAECPLSQHAGNKRQTAGADVGVQRGCSLLQNGLFRLRVFYVYCYKPLCTPRFVICI